MTLRTGELGVRPSKGEVGLFGVIEPPLRPIIGRMAVFALATEPAFMHIIRTVAINALGRRAVEGHARVTLRAVDQAVQPDQRIRAQVMIERNAAVPALLAMATVAAACECSPVWIFTAVAGLAGGP